MNNRGWRIPAFSIALALISGSAIAEGPGSPRKILVELYTSQASRTSPPASDLLGRFAKMGYGPDRVVALNFHVDSANEPWVDPFAHPIAHRRQLDYNDVFGRRDLTITPLMMVAGQNPVFGSDRSTVLAALNKAGREEAIVSLEMTLAGQDLRRSLAARILSRSAVIAGRELVVGVALTETSVTTKVLAGENAGRTLVEHQVVRRYDQKFTSLDGLKPQSLTFPVEMIEGRTGEGFQVAAFVQDRLSGEVYQAESIPWRVADVSVATKERRVKAHRSHSFSSFDPMSAIFSSSIQVPPACPDCGTPYTPEFVASQPPSFTIRLRATVPNLPLPSC